VYKKIFVLLAIVLCNPLIYSQEVKTLVKGPSTFNDGVAVDKQGNIYAANYYGSQITKITLDGHTEIFANGFNSPNGIAFGPDGYLYVPSAEGNRVDKVSPTGEVTNVIQSIHNPAGIAFDKDGNMLIAQYQSSKISIYRTNGNLGTFSTDSKLNGPVGLVFDEENNLYIGNFNDGTILKRTPDGTITEIADVPGWLGFIAYSGGYIYATAYQRNKIYRVAVDGTNYSSFAGTGATGQVDGNLSTATFDEPNGITSSRTGDTLYISDYGSRSLRMITGVNPATGIKNDKELLNKEFELQQNYPNPFNPTTSIEFSLPDNGDVELTIFDTLGREVADIAVGAMSSGVHSIDFDAAELMSGVYFYKLNYDGRSLVKKMILVK
jgi:sugar lactone lactonase YvrE